MMAADTLASYGGLARFTNVVRLHPVGKNTLIGCTGDLSDFARVKEHLHELIVEDYCEDDGMCVWNQNRVLCPGLMGWECTERDADSVALTSTVSWL